MSLAFDEGGAKGMLLSNLRLLPDSCDLVFATIECPQDASIPSNSDNYNVDISSLLRQLEDVHIDISSTICPGLDDYRRQLAIPVSEVGFRNVQEAVDEIKRQCHNIQVASSSSTNVKVFVEPTRRYFDDCDDFHDGGFVDDVDDCGDQTHYGGGDDQLLLADIPTVPDSSRRRSSMAPTRIEKPSKIQWNAVFGEPSTSSPSSKTKSEKSSSIIESLPSPTSTVTIPDWGDIAAVGNDYAFLNLDALNKSNAWAGAKHWKYATRSTQKTVSESIPVINETEGSTDSNNEIASSVENNQKDKKKSGKSSKDKFMIDFSTFDVSSINQESFAVPAKGDKAKADSTVFSSSMIDKMVTNAEELFLPLDARRSIQDLCRLFILPNITLPPPAAAEALRRAVINASSSTQMKNNSLMHRHSEVMWGQVTHKPTNGSNDMVSMEREFDGGDGFDECFNDCDQDGPLPATSVDVELQPIDCGLVQAKRIVEKIDVK
jgi:Condensin complex subunit 2